MIQVLIQNSAPRVEYAFRLVFETLLHCPVAFFADQALFARAEGVKINYTDDYFSGCLNLNPHGLLSENTIDDVHPLVFKWDDLPVFFNVENSFLPFDIFAATFYLTARYEEYLPGKRDDKGRFRSEGSVAFKNGFLEKPLVNLWVRKMAKVIEDINPESHFDFSGFSYLPTIDVDNAWAYKHKGPVRNVLSAMRDLAAGRIANLVERFRVLMHLKPDPYDTYSYIRKINREQGFKPIFFFLLNKAGAHDRSMWWRNPFLRKLIKSISQNYEVGIHPSYQSNFVRGQLTSEVLRLQTIVKHRVKFSRQHYLMLKLPETYRVLCENNIEADFTMGYADRAGYRASIATPFQFFDLKRNNATELTIYPFVVMDVTLKHYCRLTPKAALTKIEQLMDETAGCGGTFISLWHNETLRDSGSWAGWRVVYQKMTEKAAALYDEHSTTKK
ncbi:MAG: polysaccharide deacetylase family protein [Prolixibacteraceae bacterium]|nr:polysaccharide deacetylase family protein [Prolixibacteraceae bacterium]MBN2649504.1 polysaccharide deacetylase family protein [Prolixibacteraceae bacterium]